LPLHTVKINQGLVRDADRNPDKVIRLIGSLVNLGKSLELAVVVEGLEAVDLVKAASIFAADAGRGYALARPMPVDDIVAWNQIIRRGSRSGASPPANLRLLAAQWRREYPAARNARQ